MNGTEKRNGISGIDVSRYGKEISEFEKKIIDYDKGKLELKEYKPISGNFGVIPQRDGKHAVRLRMAGGAVNAEKLRFILNKAKEHNAGFIHLTTCQTVQMHGLSGEQAVDVIRSATDVGIFTKGGGGNNPRNVAASPLSGKDPAEVFDVLPFAQATENYILGTIDEWNFPSKFKISFSNGADYEVNAVAKDLGFVAAGDSFDVYLGGGMGNKGSRTGVRVMEGLDPNKTLYAVEAAFFLFTRHGPGDSRAESRFRFLRDRLGEEKFVSEFMDDFRISEERGGLDLNIGLSFGNGKINGCTKSVTVQKNGKYSVKIAPHGGDPSLEELEVFLGLLESNPEYGMRLGSDQSIYLTDLDGNIADEIASRYPVKSKFGSSLACVGYPLCQTGRRNSRGVLKTLTDMEESAGLPDGALPKIAISGCGSSCTCHQLFPIGLRGSSIKTEDGTVSAFEVHIGGSSVAGEEKTGKVIGDVPEASLPELFRTIGKEASEKGFDEWILTNGERLEELVKAFYV